MFYVCRNKKIEVQEHWELMGEKGQNVEKQLKKMNTQNYICIQKFKEVKT